MRIKSMFSLVRHCERNVKQRWLAANLCVSLPHSMDVSLGRTFSVAGFRGPGPGPSPPELLKAGRSIGKNKAEVKGGGIPPGKAGRVQTDSREERRRSSSNPPIFSFWTGTRRTFWTLPSHNPWEGPRSFQDALSASVIRIREARTAGTSPPRSPMNREKAMDPKRISGPRVKRKATSAKL